MGARYTRLFRSHSAATALLLRTRLSTALAWTFMLELVNGVKNVMPDSGIRSASQTVPT